MITTELQGQYRRILEGWIGAALPYIYIPTGRPDLECYGTGYDAWGVQTNQKALAAFAVLATDEEMDESRVGLARDEVAEHALRMLRFSLESHKAGGYHCTDGNPWGHTWISALGIERMMHGVDELESLLTDADRVLLRRVLLSECDWLADSYVRGAADEAGSVKAGLTFNNDPESNLWNGALLWRTAMMYPDARRAEEYRDQGLTFLLAGISTEADRTSDDVVDGARVRDRFVGANFFPSFALNHHGYLNVGYMVICLSQVAMAHFAWKRRGLEAPQALYRHVDELWKTVKQFTFPDGRLGRIGGATRARYCYCQDYAVPSWLLMLDRTGEPDAGSLESEWLRTLRREIAAGDGASFLSARLSGMAAVSPTYYTRLESDRACALSMALCWRRLFESEWTASRPEVTADVRTWSDDYHGATFARGPRRFASWTWRAAELPQGLCVPTGRSDMAEWRWNMAGRLLGVGKRNVGEVTAHSHALFPGGYVNAGVLRLRSEQNLAEGEADKDIAVETIAYAALPDDSTVVAIQYATAVNRAFFRSIKGIFLSLPNDVFNGGSRSYYTAAGERRLDGPSSIFEAVDLASPWVNVDDVLTLSTADGTLLTLVRPAGRQVTIRDKAFDVSSLYADELCAPYLADTRAFDTGRAVLDIGFAVRVGEGHEEAAMREAGSPARYVRGEGTRAVLVTGADGSRYVLVAATHGAADASAATAATTAATTVDLPIPSNAVLADCVTAERIEASGAAEGGRSRYTLALDRGTARLFAVE